jgi:Inorganic H+ pyrophosphatase
VRPEYGRVVDICTKDSLRELTTPGLLAVLAPIAVGFGLGVGPLAGYLAGAMSVGPDASPGLRIGIAVAAAAVIVTAVVVSKRRSTSLVEPAPAEATAYSARPSK